MSEPALAADAPSLPAPIARFDDAQRRAIAMLGDVIRRLEAGMSERDVYELAETRLGDHGFDTWYHPPEVSVGKETANTRKLPFPPSASRKIEVGQLVTIDLAPGNGEAYGDIGATLRFGGGDEPLVLTKARECVRACVGYASRWKTCGEIFIAGEAFCVNNRMKLGNSRAIGHRVLQKEGMLATGFPRSAHLATLLPRNQLHRLNPVRMQGMFAIRPTVLHKGEGASFEEMIYIQDDVRRILGRASLADVGTW